MDRLAGRASNGPMNVNNATASTSRTTLVLGAGGKTGRRVAERLRVLGWPVRAGSRAGDPPFDWENPETWEPVVTGVSAAYVTYQPDVAFPGAAARVREFAALAIANGVRRLVLLSGRNEPRALEGEQAVQVAGADWTIVRSSFFDQNFSEGLFTEQVIDGTVLFPATDTTEPFVDVEDIAEIATEALTTDRHVGALYEVTGPRLLTFGDAVAEIAAATGRDLRYFPITLDEYADGMRAEGVPEDDVQAYIDLFATVLDGRGSYLSDGVQRALGRAPRDFRDYARETSATGVWNARQQKVG